ncbi:aminotransferase class IV [Streptomyces sp. NPDC050610]|uniref:aminotransferase class IV n=1 Tax=Streptomyces sp. NPDC050610 TaxID=3157097 RepID=UPI00343DC225
MTDLPDLRIELDGRVATAEELFAPLMSNYGHFTAMQVRGRAVRGLDLHLARLDAATRELFGAGLDGGRVRELIRHALGGVEDASVRVNVFVPAPEAEPSVLVSVRPPTTMPATAQALRTVPYERPVAHVKHTGGFAQGYFRQQVQRAGFDEALLVGPDGTVAEGAITNVAFIDGDTVVWPDAPALDGISMLLLRQELDAAGLPWRRSGVRTADLASYGGAFLTNSQGIAPISRIDDLAFPADVPLVAEVVRIFGMIAADVI